MQRLTDLNTIRDLCRRHGFSLKKGLGQHFLVNPAVCPRLCDAAGLTKDFDVLEIGPGFGTLTQELAARANKVLSLEVDGKLLPVLDETLDGLDNVTVVHGDVMKEDLAALIAKHLTKKVVVCANLPYYITSPILMRILEDRLPVESVTVLVQMEAAKRITAKPGTREAGAITYAAHYYTSPKYMFTVSPGSFYPPPKVKSAVMHMPLVGTPPLAQDTEREIRLFKLIRAGFGQRRKTLANAASAGLSLPKEQLAAAIEAAGLQESVRPEQLTLNDYISLEAALWP